MKIFLKKQNKNGFSLIEIIFSIGLITVGLVSILSLFNYNIKNGIRNKNKLVAIYLAEEQIEIIRQLRDNNWFINKDWMFQIPSGNVIASLIDSGDIRKGWEIETSNANIKKVYLFNSSYVQFKNDPIASWQETNFERYLTITKGDGDSGNSIAPGCFDTVDCMEITSHVFLNGTQIIEITAYLYDKWYQ